MLFIWFNKYNKDVQILVYYAVFLSSLDKINISDCNLSFYYLGFNINLNS